MERVGGRKAFEVGRSANHDGRGCVAVALPVEGGGVARAIGFQCFEIKV